RRLGAARLPDRPRRARRLPRAVLPRRPRPRRGAAGAVAGLLHLPGTDRLLGGRAVAGRAAAADRHPGPIGRLLRAFRGGPAGPQLGRGGADPGPGPPPSPPPGCPWPSGSSAPAGLSRASRVRLGGTRPSFWAS